MNYLKKHNQIIVVTIISMLMLFAGNSMGFDGTPPRSEVILIGPDKIPCNISYIDKGDENETTIDWINKNFVTDQTSEKFYLPESVTEITVDGYSGIAFKTWDYLNIVQNVIIEKEDTYILYSTPDGDYNPDGTVVFQKILGITLPETPGIAVFNHDIPDLETQYGQATASCTNKCSSNVKIGDCSGIFAYSNGEKTGGGGTCGTNSVSGYTTGYKWQCVEYVNRYFFQKFGKKISWGNANTYYSNASSKGLKNAKNGGTDKPQTGNIICSAGGSYGHVAIIKEVGSNYIKVVQQNWSCSSSEIKLSMSVKSKDGKKYYTVSGFSSSYPIQGWLWPK